MILAFVINLCKKYTAHKMDKKISNLIIKNVTVKNIILFNSLYIQNILIFFQELFMFYSN